MSNHAAHTKRDYANTDDQISRKEEFASALAALTELNGEKISPARVVDLINRLFEADDQLNHPHTILVHQRAKLLSILLESYAQLSKIGDCWSTVKKIACLQPYSENIEPLIETVANSLRCEKRTNVVLLISCHPRVSIALTTQKKLKELLGAQFRVIIVLGQRTLDMHPSYLLDDVLVVDSDDNYESLPGKVTKAFQFIYSHFGAGTNCFKVDEDLPINDAGQLKRLMTELSRSRLNYAGFAGNNRENFERTWHFGKCEDKSLSRRPYGKRYPGAFAYGPFYYLSASALKTFCCETIRFPDEIIGHLYEDKFVGDTLREGGYTINALCPEEWVPAVGENWWTVNRLWSGKVNSILQSEHESDIHAGQYCEESSI